MLIIGSHVSMKGKDMFLGSVKEALSYDANALMIYTGAPQNTRRKPVEELNVPQGQALLKEHNIPMENVVVHAPYIINLANTIKKETYELAVQFLEKEIDRVEQIGAKYLVLHPGSHVGAGTEQGLNQIVKGLNTVLKKDQNVIVCLETMSGKGSECGKTFEELKYIIDNVKLNDKLGVCLDTCHINDAGYDLTKIDDVLEDFDKTIGLDRLHVIHVNDSKNDLGVAKDRHANLGYGKIGFKTIMSVINHSKLDNIIKVLETPYTHDRTIPPYKQEIKMVKENKFEDWIK